MDRSAWEPVLLVATAVLAVGLPWRVHLRAVRAPQRWRVVPYPLVSLTIGVATAWAVATVLDGRSSSHVLPAVATAVLAAGGELVRSRSTLDPATPVLAPYVVSVVLAASLAAGVAWSLLDSVGHGAEVAVAALVMASPAAALLAVPAAFGTGAAAARAAGVRLADLATVEAATVVDTLVLAKDGTVTTGDLTVVSVDTADPDHDRNLRWFAGALAKASPDDRVARAVATLSGPGRPSDVEILDGLGMQGSVDRHPVRVGTPTWIGIEASPTIWTTVGVEVDGRALGSVTIADDVRPDLTRDVARLRDLGLDLVMVSDDTEERTRHVAALAGIQLFHVTGPDLVVRDLVAAGRHVATVGLPLTDGADLAVTTSEPLDGPTITADTCAPARVADALTLARRTAERIRRTRTLTTALTLLGVAAAATGLAGPVVAALVGAGIVATAALLATTTA